MLALGGCTDEPEEDLRTSGPLAEGFVIEPGSALIGPVFVSGQDDGMRVVLRVDGDLQRVFGGYVRQAGELGLPVGAGLGRPEGQWCSDDPAAWYTTRSDAAAFEVECTASGYEPGTWSLRMRGLADGDGPVASATDVEVAPDLAVPEDDPPIRIVEGSELVFDPLPSECEQFADARFDGMGLVGDDDAQFVGSSAAGGGTLSALGVAGEPSYVLIERCND